MSSDTKNVKRTVRFLPAILLALLVGAACSAVGYSLRRPVYRSTGLVRVAYSPPNAVPGDYIQSQRTLMTSPSAIRMAIRDPLWKAASLQPPAEPDRYFEEHLDVKLGEESGLIIVSITDSDRIAAAATVNSVINSYVELCNEKQDNLQGQRIGVLQDRATSLRAKIDQLDRMLRDGGKEYGTTDLGPFYDAAASRVTKLQSALEDVRMAIASAPADAASVPAIPKAAAGTTKPATQPEDELSVRQIAASDPVMLGYVNELDRLEDDLQRLRASYSDAHPSVVNARASIATARERIEKYAQIYRQFHAASKNSNDPSAPPVTRKSVDGLRANEQALVNLLERAKKELVALGTRHYQFRREKQELDSLRGEQEQITRRIDALRSEPQAGERASIITIGQVPQSPDTGPRLRAAAAAGAGGAALSIAVFAVWSLARRHRLDSGKKTKWSPEPYSLATPAPSM